MKKNCSIITNYNYLGFFLLLMSLLLTVIIIIYTI
jgi:hypothetical protein